MAETREAESAVAKDALVNPFKQFQDDSKLNRTGMLPEEQKTIICCSLSKRSGAGHFTAKKLCYSSKFLQIWGGKGNDNFDRLLFREDFSDIYLARVDKQLLCVNPDDESQRLTLHPLKLKLRNNVKLTLHFCDEQEIDELMNYST